MENEKKKKTTKKTTSKKTSKKVTSKKSVTPVVKETPVEVVVPKNKKKSKDIVLPAWEKRTSLEKGLTIAQISFSVLTIIFCILYLCGAFENANLVFMPTICLDMICQTMLWWKYDHSVKVISLTASICTFVCVVLAYIIYFVGL